MKGHKFNQLANDLRDIAVKYGHTQQLRSRIVSRLKEDIEIDPPKNSCGCPEGQPHKGASCLKPKVE